MPWIAALAGFASNMISNGVLDRAGNRIQGLASTGGASSTNPFGAFGMGPNRHVNIQQSPEMRAMLQQLMGGNSQFLGGGLFNNPDFQNAFQNNDIFGAQQNQNQQLGMQMGPEAFQGGLGGLFGNAMGLNNMFAQNVGQGFQDQTGGLQNALFGAGAGMLGQAGNTSGLVQQNLDASRALAQPFEDRLLNRTQNQLFAQGRLGSTGGAQQFGETIGSIQRGDNQRIMNAQGLGLQQQNQMGQLGLGALGQGNQLFGNNMNLFGQQMQGFGQTGQFAQGLEGQGFSQLLQSLTQNQSSGQQRLQNAMGMFGLGNQTLQGNFGMGLQGLGVQNQQQQMMNQLILGLMNADNSRIGAQSGFAGAMGSLGSNQAGMMGGMLSGMGDIFQGMRG